VFQYFCGSGCCAPSARPEGDTQCQIIRLGPDGRVRYVIRKSVTNPDRIDAQARHAETALGTTWTEHNRRLHPIATTLRELHARQSRMGAAGT